MSNKLHVVKCLNCIHVNKISHSMPCLNCYIVNLYPKLYDLFHNQNKFVQRQGISVKHINGSKIW